MLSVPITGGTVATIASAQNKPCGIAIKSDVVYWATCGDGRVAKFEQGALETVTTGHHISGGFVLDNDTFFWSYIGSVTGTGEISTFPLGGAGSSRIAAGQVSPYKLVVDSTHVYWTDYGSGNGDGAIMRELR